MDNTQMDRFVDVDRIEFNVTYRCNSHCKHCSVGLEKRGWDPAAINIDLATQIVTKLCRAYSGDPAHEQWRISHNFPPTIPFGSLREYEPGLRIEVVREFPQSD